MLAFKRIVAIKCCSALPKEAVKANMHLSFKRDWFGKTWLKYTNRRKYRRYKQLLIRCAEYETAYGPINKFVAEKKDLTIDEIFDRAKAGYEINLLHSGNSGDIIYSLPVVKRLAEITSKPVNFLLQLDQPMVLAPGDTHPLNNVMLNKPMANNLIPLLTSQPYINHAEIYTDQPVHLNLSLFREAGLELDRGNIARWNFYTTGINADLSKPWLNVNPNREFSEIIVLARSSRYNNPLISYSFLSEHDVVFVGVKQEYEKMKRSIPNLAWHAVSSFLELAEVIKGSKLFIGNQSFPFSVAEGLKVVRVA